MPSPFIFSTLGSQRGFRAALLLAALLPLRAQQPVPVPSSDDSRVRLDPFQVSAVAYDQYLPAEATVGTRYASSVLEIPFPVNVITAEFIEDFKLHNINDALDYTAGFTPDPAGGTGIFVLRGIRNTSNFKNGVWGGFIFGPASVDRIEVVKGTNASVYGQTEPTGLVNTVTKQALLDRHTFSASGGIGTDDWQRWNVEVNVPIVRKKFGVRVAAQYDESYHKSAEFYYFRRGNVYLTARYQLSPRTWIAASCDYVDTHPHAAGISPVVRVGNTNAGFMGLGPYKQHYGFNVVGPKSENAVEIYTSDLQFNHRFSDVFSFRLYLNHENRQQPQFRVSGGGQFTPATGLIQNNRTTFVNYGDIGRKAGQIDLLSSFSTGPVSHKVLATFDYLDDYGTTTRRNRTALLPALSVTDPVYYNFPQTHYVDDPAVFGPLVTWGGRHNITQGLLVSERASLLKGRLVALGGVRYDTVKTMINDRLLPPGRQQVRLNTDDTTFQTGLLFRATPTISLYASFSESFQPQINTTEIDFDGNPLPPFRGSGADAGVKASLRDNAINFTLGWFTVTKDNIGRVATDDTGNVLRNRFGAEYRLPGAQASRGVELDYNVRFSPAFTVFGSYAYIDAKWTKVPDQRHLPRPLTLIGLAPAASPKHNASFGFRYALDHLGFKGVRLHSALRHYTEAFVVENVRDVNGNLFFNPALTLVDAGASYAFRPPASKLRYRFDFNVKNLFDRQYLIGRNYGDKFAMMGTFGVAY